MPISASRTEISTSNFDNQRQDTLLYMPPGLQPDRAPKRRLALWIAMLAERIRHCRDRGLM
jgi:hypothetical protein